MSKKIKLNKTLLKAICKERLEQIKHEYKLELRELQKPIIEEYLIMWEENEKLIKDNIEQYKVSLEKDFNFKDIDIKITGETPAIGYTIFMGTEEELPKFSNGIIFSHGCFSGHSYGTYMQLKWKRSSNAENFFIKICQKENYEDIYRQAKVIEAIEENLWDHNIKEFVDKVMVELALQQIDQDNFDEVHRVIDEVIKI